MRKFYFPLSAVVLLAFAVGARAADAIVLNVTGDQTLAAALTAYNAANGTAYVDTDGGASLGAADIEVRGDGVLTFSTALDGWTGNLFVKEGATVHAASDEANYASVLGAGVSGTTTNGQVFVASGASLRIRTAASQNEVSQNERKLARPVHLAGVGVGGKGALQLASAGNYRAAFPRAILLDADAQLSRLDNGDTVGEMVMHNSTDLVLNGHVLTLAKAGKPLKVYIENIRILAPGAAGGLAVTDGCQFVMRPNTRWEGGANNAVRIEGAGKLSLQADFPRAPWTLVYNTTQRFEPESYQDWPDRDASGTVRCWAGPAQLLKDFRCIDNSTALYQVGFRGKVTGPGGICVADTSSADRPKWFHLVSGENDFTGGFAATNVLVRLGAPTAVPSGAAAGPMELKNCDVDFNYDVPAGGFAFPATTFEGAGVFHSMLYDVAARPHAGTFASLVKTGAGTLALKVRLDGGALDIREGCVRFADIVPDGVIFGQSGKFTCYQNPFTATDATTDIGWGKKPLKEVAPYILYTNTTTTALSIFSFPHGRYDGVGNLWGEKFYQRLCTYAGWLWNTSAETKTLKVVCTLNAYVRLTIGEALYTTAEPSRWMNPGDLVNPKGVWTVSVLPGANRFEVRVYDRYGIPGKTETNNATGEPHFFCYGNVCTNGLANWDDVHGLAWSENLSSVDLNDFHRFEDAHGGLKLTWGEDGKGGAAAAHCLDALSGAGTLDLANNALTVRAPSASDFPCLSAKGAMLNLGGQEATTRRLDGFVTATNGVLVLDGAWTLAKAEVQDPDAVSAGIAFSGASRLVLSEAEQRELSDEMPAGGYLLATSVTGCPRFSKAADAKIALFARDGHLILGRNPGTMVIVR